MKKYSLLLYSITLGACNLFEGPKMDQALATSDTVIIKDVAAATVDTVIRMDSVQARGPVVADGTHNRDTALLPPSQTINTGRVHPDTLVNFAKTLVGTPYVYASSDPEKGFDCSGFITYVFNHFGIAVPRSSVDFTGVGKTVAVADARRGDLILFTGTDSTEKHIGHMGLIVANDGSELQFIHSTSGKAKGVTITPLNAYYKKRFVRIARIFSQND
jgi:cell wall-associated NlpC family hydrolase